MSNALAIAATTATLRKLLDDKIRLADPDLPGGLLVKTQPPDIASKEFGDNGIGLNVFLYQTQVNAAWRNMDMPVAVRPGELGLPPLALNLHYLLTAYGSEDSVLHNQAHRILGAALSVMHDNPLLSPDAIASALNGNDLARQFERMRITPLPLNVEELSKLWTIFQTQYRISAALEVTVVLIDSKRPTNKALPVIRRGEEDRGIFASTGQMVALKAMLLPRSQSAVRLGDDFEIEADPTAKAGDSLRFRHQTTDDIVKIPAVVPTGNIAVHLPTVAAEPAAITTWTPGFYTVDLVQLGPADIELSSNALPLALAPSISLPQRTFAAGTFTLPVKCEPRLHEDQTVVLLFGSRQIEPNPWANPGNPLLPTTLNFEITEATVGKYVVRLRVDGVDSIPLAAGAAPQPPAFDPLQTVSIQ